MQEPFDSALSKRIACVLLVAVSLGAPERSEAEGIAARYPGDEGIGKDPAVLFATGFEDGIEEPLKTRRKGVVVLKDPNIAHNGEACVQITATRGVDEGGDVRLRWDQGVRECYMRVYVRFDQNTLMPHHFINLRGHTPTYKYRWGGAAGLRPPGGRDGAFGTTLEPPKNEKGEWKFYSYWHEMRSWQTPHGASDGRPNAFYGNNFAVEDSPPVRRDEWMCLEIMIKLNDLGRHNGEQAFWIDGEKIGHWKPGSPEGTWLRGNFYTFGGYNQDPKPFEGISWRTDELLKVNVATLQWYLSRDQSWKKMNAEKNIVYFDDWVVATKYIGPMSER